MLVVIVDDEKHCRTGMGIMLEKYCEGTEVVAMCANGKEGIRAIETHRPDLVFLDIEMPGMNGFEMLEQCHNHDFEVIFTTAYNEYAIQAIRHSALDYLLKPIDKEDLAAAIEKIKNKQQSISKAQVKMATEVHNRQLPDTIALPSADGLTFAAVNDIIYCIADGSYTRMFMMDKNEILLSKTLGDVEDLLTEYNFFRIHHSSLINLKQVKKYIRGEGGEVIMSNGKNLIVARTRKSDFLNVFTRF